MERRGERINGGERGYCNFRQSPVGGLGGGVVADAFDFNFFSFGLCFLTLLRVITEAVTVLSGVPTFSSFPSDDMSQFYFISTHFLYVGQF